ncbi:ABC transporter ATP-binding protein [Frigidibacter sp. MR17.14]|uniref:ABC transporter ATP-binding protein n=1 Tax=Frigidibacter sp. MR17.14 TaxID=3126509 RepID=UPI003012C207
MTASALRTRNLAAGYAGTGVLDGIDLDFAARRITAIVGANACGKSTLLRALARLLVPSRGQVLLDGRSIRDIAPKALARQLGLLPQSPIAPEGISVLDLVGHGRHPHQRLFGGFTAADEAAVAEALDATGTRSLAQRDVTDLSGGQRQRVWIALALAQQTGVLLLDEPTTFLDINHQIEVLDLLAALNRDRGTTIVMVLHDLNLAARYADRLVALRAGCVHSAGPPSEVLTEAMVREVFGLEALVMPDPLTGRPMIIPCSRSPTGRRASDRTP